MAVDIFSNLRPDGKTMALETLKNKIKQYSSDGTYQDLEDFISDNPDLETFQNHTKLNNILRKVWGYQITDEEYLAVLEQLKKEVLEKRQINLEKVKTVEANGKEITTFQSGEETMVLDNSYAQKSLKEQLPDLQAEHKQFQEKGEENIESMMEYMQAEVKPEFGFTDISDIDSNTLSTQEQENLAVATQYQEVNETPIKADLQNGLILQNGEIQTIERREDGIGIYQAEASQSDQEETKEEKPKVRTLQRLKQAGFSNALILAFLTGMVLGFIFLNMFVKTIIS